MVTDPGVPERPAALSEDSARRVFYCLTLTRWAPVGLVVGLLILLQVSRGLTTAQALTATAAAGIVCFALELPTSGFADALGRRPVYLAAAALNIGVALAYLTADSFGTFLVAGALMGAFRALDSGPLEAWFVDTVHAHRPGADVDRPLAVSGVLLGAAMAAGALLGGLLVWWHPIAGRPALELPVLLFVVGNVLHLIAAALLMREAPSAVAAVRRRDRLVDSVRDVPRTIGSALGLLRRNVVLRGLIAVEIFWALAMIVFEQGLSLRLEELLGGAEEAGAIVGPVSALGWGVFAAGSALAGILVPRLGLARTAMAARVANGLGAAAMGLAAGPVALVAFYTATYAFHGTAGAPHSALLHREATSANRTTVMSLNSMVSFLAFSLWSPLVGVAADLWTLQTAMVAAGALSVLGVLCYLPALRRGPQRV